MNFKKVLLILLISAVSSQAFGKNDFLDSLFKKQAVKSQKRWTLSNWIVTKQKVNLMDMWLAANTDKSNLFEFVVSGNISSYENTLKSGLPANPVEGDVSRAGVTAYVSIIGLQYEQVEDKEVGLSSQFSSVNLRLLGFAEQGTNLTLHYGKRDINDKISSLKYSNNFWGGSLSLYLMSFVGIKGSFSTFMPTTLSSGLDLEATRATYGLFAELGFVRVFGNLYSEVTKVSDGSQTTQDGIETGLKLYF